jgi:SAM-dependent methyltransferase
VHPSLLERLICSTCRHDAPLRLEAEEQRGEEIVEGLLDCTACGARFPIRRGTPRFVPSDDDYCSNFGYQWQRWKGIQIDRIQGHRLSERRFFDESPWDGAWLRDKWILDVGCGAGRFADVAAGAGAIVVACDISDAIDACRDNTSVHGSRVHTVQASVYALPFREASFDAAYCYGVIQHTPDPRRTMETIPRFVKADGLLAYDFYEKTPWERPWVPHFFLRRWTPRWSKKRLLAFSHVLTALFFPAGWLLSRIPLFNQFCALLPIAVFTSPELSLRAQYQWTVLDTFDWYGPQFEQRQSHREVAGLLRAPGLQDIHARPGVVNARLPGGRAGALDGRRPGATQVSRSG